MTDVSMPSLMSWKTDPIVLEHTWDDVVLYALGVGARAEQLSYLYENAPGGLQVLPSWAVVPEKRLTRDLEAQLDHTRMLHGEQLIRQHRPIPPSGKLTVSAEVKNIYDKGKAAVIHSGATAKDEQGNVVFETLTVGFYRGGGGFGGDPGPKAEPLDPPAGLLIMLHKPLGYTCSTKDHGELIYELLPPRFRLRSPIVSSVGRLDRDTSGLLLMTDDGVLLHRISSPKHKLAKVYEVTLARELHGDEGKLFASGKMMLESEKEPLAPAELEVIDARHARVTVTEGRYHQVRRMFAAVGNHVETLHRPQVGGLVLGDLMVAEWKILNEQDRNALFNIESDQT